MLDIDRQMITNMLVLSFKDTEDPRFPKKIRIFLTKVGKFEHDSYGKFSVTSEDIDQMVANHGKDDRACILDYEHLSESSNSSPEHAIAAGIIDTVEVEGDGDNKRMFGWVKLNKNAIEKIQAGEYLFISPVISRNGKTETGKKFGTYLRSAALTNHPFFAGQDLVKLSSKGDTMADNENNQKIEDVISLNEKLLKEKTDTVLQLADVSKQLEDIKGKYDNAVKSLSDKDKETLSLTDRISKLEKDLILKEVESYIDLKLNDGVIVEAEKQDYIEIGLTNISKMKRMLDARKPVIGLNLEEKGGGIEGDNKSPELFLNEKVNEEIAKGKTFSEAWEFVEKNYKEQFKTAQRPDLSGSGFEKIN